MTKSPNYCAKRPNFDTPERDFAPITGSPVVGAFFIFGAISVIRQLVSLCVCFFEKYKLKIVQ